MEHQHRIRSEKASEHESSEGRFWKRGLPDSQGSSKQARRQRRVKTRRKNRLKQIEAKSSKSLFFFFFKRIDFIVESLNTT
jgi:hypothetical protein